MDGGGSLIDGLLDLGEALIAIHGGLSEPLDLTTRFPMLENLRVVVHDIAVHSGDAVAFG
jgi:hypothetical protein